MADTLEEQLAADLGAAAPQGMRRRTDVSSVIASPDYAKESEAAITRASGYGRAVTGLARQVAGDQEGAMEDYRRSRARDDLAATQDSDQSTDWRDIGSVGDAVGYARKLAIGSAPDAVLSLGVGAAARGLARRAAVDVERRAIAARVAGDLATPGVNTPLVRQVAERVSQGATRAATPAVARAQTADAVQDVAGEALERMPAAQRRIDRAGRAGAFVGAAAGQFPGMVSGSREELEQTDQAGALKIAAGDAAAAAIGAIPAERVLGRVFNNPAARQAVQERAAGLLPQLAQRAGKVAKEGATQSLVEGTTEAAQAAVQRAGHAWVNENISLLSREALDDYVANFVGGATLGGVIGASVETSAQAPGAAVDAGRWAWDKTGGARTEIRERLGAIAEKARQAAPKPAAPEKAPRGQAKPQEPRTSSDMFRDALGKIDGVVGAGLDAVGRFREGLNTVQKEEDLDARADAVMDRLQAFTQRDDGDLIGDGVLGKAGSFSQKWMLSQVNPDFLSRVPESDALRLGRILEKYAGGKDLSPIESRTLARVSSNPESGLTQDVLDTFIGVGPKIADLDKRLSDTADADAPRLAQQRAPDTVEVTEADQANAQADAIAAGEDASGVDIRDLNSGVAVQGADAPRPIDAMNTARQTVIGLRERLGEGAAQDPAYGEAMAAGQLAREQARTDILRGAITRNNKAADFYAKRKDSADTVELVDQVDVTDGRGNMFQPQLLDLGTLIQRQQAAIRAEGTSADNVPAEQALMRGLAEAAQAGVRINPDTFSVGPITVGGREILRITPRLRAQLRQDSAALADLATDDFAPIADSADLDAEFALTERPDDLQGESAIDTGVFDDGRERVPREAPPGVQVRERGDIRNLDFVPDEGVVSDVRADSPYAKQLNQARKAYAGAKTPRDRAAAMRGAGIEIGTLEIQREYDAGQMNPQRYEREMERLRDPESGLAERYLQRASRGAFDTAGVTHRKADNDAPRGKDRDDATGNAANKQTADKIDRRSNAGLKDKRTQDAGRARAREDEATQRNTDVDPAPAIAPPSVPISERQIKAEQTWVSEVLKLAGLGNAFKLRVLPDAKSPTSGAFKPGLGEIHIGANLRDAERQEVIMHELGHAIVWAEVAREAGMTTQELLLDGGANWEASMMETNRPLYDSLQADYQAWVAQFPADVPMVDLREARSPAFRSEGVRARLGERQLKLSDRTPEQQAYEISFDEWIADNVARALLARKDVTDSMTRADKFFTAVANKLRAFYDSVVGRTKFKPAPSVEAWVSSMFDRDVNAVRRATGIALPPAQAQAVVEAAAYNRSLEGYETQATALAKAAERFNRAPRAEGGNAGLGNAVDPTAPPFPGADRIGKKRLKKNKPPREFAAMVEYVRAMLKPAERQQLYDLFNQPVVHQRLQKVYAQRPDVLAAIENAQTGMESRIAAGYLAWKAGKFDTGPKGRSLLRGIGDDLMAVFGLAGNGAVSMRLLDDLAAGTVAQFRKNGRDYDARRLATRGRGPVQDALNKFGDIREKVWAPVSKAMEGNSKRMFESGVPAMRQIAGLLYKPTGTTGTDRGMVRETVHRTAQFAERAASILGDLPPNQQRRVLQLLQEQADDARLSKKITKRGHKDLGKNRYSPKIRRAVREVRALMNEAFDYMDQAGVRVGYRKNFFPVMLDLRNERAKDRLTALLSDPAFEDDIRAFYDDGAKKPKGDDAKAVPIADLVKRLVDGASGTGAPAKTAAGAPNFRGANYRVMEFIYRLGTPAQIKEFAALQTKNPAEAFARYLEPMVRRTEYARRFKDDGAGLDKLLDDMHRQGATDVQLREAREAVEAALGTYGSDLSPTLEAISPALAQRFSGTKTRAATQGLQAYQNARLLPLALISSFVDPMGIAVRSGGDFATSWQGFKSGVRSLVNKDKRGELADMMKLLGASSDMATMEALQQGFGGAGNTTAAKVNDFIFRWNGMAAWTRATRYMALTAAHHFLLKHAAGTSPASKRYLRELGLQDGDIRADPAATTADGAPRQQVFLMDADMIKRAKPAQREADARVKAALMQFVDDAVLRPNSQQVPQWHSDPFMGLVTQYKAFSYAIYDQIMGRIDTELKNGNSKVLLAAGAYVPIVIAAEMLRDVAQGDGEDKEDWGAGDWLGLGVERSGLYSPVFGAAEGIVDDVQNNRTPGSSSIGPTASQARNVTQALTGTRDLGKEFESALPGSAWYRKWNDGQATDLPDPS